MKLPALFPAIFAASLGWNLAQAAEPSVLQLTTRQQTIQLVPVPSGTRPVLPKEVSLYGTYGYSAWKFAAGDDQGRKLDLMPAGYQAAPNAARLLSFFSMSDVHITDKESPAQVPYYGWNAAFLTSGLYSQAYSPVELSTTQVLDAAVKSVNAIHRQSPFDFGIFLGDVANSSQFNELRWFIDVVDGKYITPASGAQLGADTIDYQKPFKAAGLDRSIPWYEVIGNHDQLWMGVNFPSEKLQNAMVGSTVLNMGTFLFAPNATDLTGIYVGVIDGTTALGDVIKGGPVAGFATPPTVVADSTRHPLATTASFSKAYMTEFFSTASSPVGHGFTQANLDGNSACYTFEPVANLPLKVIVLDDTCKTISVGAGPSYYGGGWIDEARFTWLTNELQKGQDAGQLMIIACHIPINPQKDLFDKTPNPQFYPSSFKSDAQLIDTLRNYSNLLMVMAGHRHINVVTPFPSTDATHPENGFWQVETPSLRDFPRQLRTFDIRRNSDNTVSIMITGVDPSFTAGSLAEKSLGYAVGAMRIYGNTPLSDATSHAYNAELVKKLSPAMQAKIANYGAPLGRLSAVSARGLVDAGSKVLMSGFVVTGTSPKQVLIRGVGPTLVPMGVSAALSQPVLTVYDGQGKQVATNTGWGTNANASQVAAAAVSVGDFALPSGSADSALLLTLPPGNYSVHISGANNTSGVALAEVYELNSAGTSPLPAIATRAQVGTGANILISGFVINGSTPINVMIRGVGPSLTSKGVTQAEALQQPVLKVFDAQGKLVASNTGWGTAINAANIALAASSVGDFALSQGSADSALLLTLAPGAYSAQISGLGDTSGIALAEIYQVQ